MQLLNDLARLGIRGTMFVVLGALLGALCGAAYAITEASAKGE